MTYYIVHDYYDHECRKSTGITNANISTFTVLSLVHIPIFSLVIPTQTTCTKVLARAQRKEGGNVNSMTISKAWLHSYDHIKGIETRKEGGPPPLCPFS